MTAPRMAFFLSAEAAAFTVPSENTSPACLQSVPTAALLFLPSKIKVAHLSESIRKGKTAIWHLHFGAVTSRRLGSKKAR